MQITTHHALAARRRRQALALSLGGTAVLVVGLVLNFRQQFAPAFVALLVGAALSYVGVALSDRWVGLPRPDRALADGLRARGGRAFHLYNWVLPADHVLLGPWGLTTLHVFNHDGPAVIRGRRWRDGRPAWQRWLRLARRPLTDPSKRAHADAEALRAALAAADAGLADVPIDAVAVFTHPAATLDVADAVLPVLRAADLAELVRGAMRRPRLAPERARRLEAALDAMAEARLASR